MSIADVENVDDLGIEVWDRHDLAGFADLLADEFTFLDNSWSCSLEPDQL